MTAWGGKVASQLGLKDKKGFSGTSLAVQWLRLCTSTAGATDTTQPKKKKKRDFPGEG